MTHTPEQQLPRARTPAPAPSFARYLGVVQTAAGLSFLTALWLIASPWILDQQRAAVPTWDQAAVGGLLAVVTVSRLTVPVRLHRLWQAEFALGLWTICAGFVLSYPAGYDRVPVLWNHILTGAVVLALAGFSAAARDSYVAART